MIVIVLLLYFSIAFGETTATLAAANDHLDLIFWRKQVRFLGFFL